MNCFVISFSFSFDHSPFSITPSMISAVPLALSSRRSRVFLKLIQGVRALCPRNPSRSFFGPSAPETHSDLSGPLPPKPLMSYSHSISGAIQLKPKKLLS